MQRSRLLLAALIASTVAAAPQGDVKIQHDPVDCWPIDQFLVIQPSFEPPADIQTAKLYFRSNTQPDYYYVELTLSRDGGRAIAPKAAQQTAGVVYYIELVTRSFSSFRSEEHEVPVASGAECRRRDPEAAYYTGQNPDIAVGSTRIGVPQMPPGFQADGISRFIHVSGVSGEAGTAGGISGKNIGIIAGVGGGVAVAGLALGGGPDSAITTSAIGGVTSTTTEVSTSTATGGGSSSTTTSVGGSGSTSSLSTTVPSSSTTTTVMGSSTTTSGPGSSTTSSSAPTTTSTSTAPASTTTSAASSNVDLSVVKREGQDPVVVGTVFDYFIDVTNHGPANASVVGLNDNFPYSSLSFLGSQNAVCSPAPPLLRCSIAGGMTAGSTRTVRLLVRANSPGQVTNSVTVVSTQTDPNSSNNSSSVTTRVNASLRESSADTVELTYASTLNPRPSETSVRGYLVFNQSHLQEVESGGPRVLSAKAQSGENHFEAYLEPSAKAQGLWRFDFSGSSGFVPGSIRVQSGNALSLNGYAVVFAFSESTGPVRFAVELRGSDP